MRTDNEIFINAIRRINRNRAKRGEPLTRYVIELDGKIVKSRGIKNLNLHNNGPGIITKATADRLKEFNTARDWDEIHTPANLAKSISIESAELLELFQWDEKSYDIERVKEELADVIIYSLIMVEALNLDADAIVNEKITKNSKKYPTGVQVKDGNK